MSWRDGRGGRGDNTGRNFAGDGRDGRGTTPWSGTAFLVEACILLAIVTGSVGVFASLFAAASRTGAEAEQLTRAVVAARDAAERFGAEALVGEWEASGSDLVVRVEAEPDDAVPGLLRALITVSDANGDVVYELETARAGGDAS